MRFAGAWPALHLGAARLQKSTPTQLKLDLRFLVPRGTGQPHTWQEQDTKDRLKMPKACSWEVLEKILSACNMHTCTWQRKNRRMFKC